ncbi:ABC transporter permease [Paenibacillus sp. SC116]|uniref:ABC transporter permease n=1 Tax=Paenibacillus sp. SC116 TaxID=2968986 RepID=UPI00215AD743|nr:ABC transporter permease [Paenibacillus sp. SC116]MCR8846286.1 ABC transporter permease [Paenibacillus sp. SC116]
MKGIFKVLRSEAVKLRHSKLSSLLLISPLLSLSVGVMYNSRTDMPWLEMYGMMALSHAILFLPLMTGIISALMCRYEHANGGWKQTLALPISRTSLYIGKFLIICFMTLAMQLLFFIAVVAAGMFKGFEGPIPISEIVTFVVSGWIATLPLAALQLFVSTMWASFAAALTINVIFTLPNLLIVQSGDYGPYYPWAQPGLAMLPMGDGSINTLGLSISLETLLFVIGGSFLVFFLTGLLYFQRKDVA